jgi:hypothetical protein
MSDKVTPEELERLLRQLQGHDLEAIGRRLGLDLHGPDKSEVLRKRLGADAKLRKRAQKLALTLPAKAQCSFCGERASESRRVITSPTGASVCSVCLQDFKSGAP